MSYDGTIRLDTAIDDKGATDDLSKLGTVVAAGATAALAALAGLGAAAIKVGSDFEAAMSQVEAISGASGKELESLTNIAKEMGETTKFSATQSAEALTYMAMAGWKTEQMIAGLPGIMNLAAASGEDLGTVADIVTDALTGFGMAAEESGHFADVLAAASNNANTNVAMLGESFKYVAPVAGALGFSVEDVSVALGLMANSGIKASQAGTSLRSLLTNLVKPTDRMAVAMADLGIEITNLDGSMKPLSQIMVEMRASFDGLTESEQAMYAATLAGQQGMSGLLAIINASDEEFDSLAAAIANADGTAQRMADTMNDNLQGKLTLLGSALEGVGIQVYEHFQEPLKQAVAAATVSVGQLADSLGSPKMQNALDKLATGFSDLTKSAANLASKAIPALVSVLAFAAENFDTIAQLSVTLVAAFGAFRIITSVTQWMNAMNASMVILANTQGATTVATLAANGAMTLSQIAYALLTGQITLATAAQAAWNLALSANPIGLIVVAVAALVAGIILLRNAFVDTSSVTDEFNSELESLQSNLDSLEEASRRSADAHSKNIDSIEAESIAAQNLASKVADLAAIEDKSAADKLRLKQTVDLLNQSVSGLNLVYDEHNDKLLMNGQALENTAEQIGKVVEAQKQRLLQQAREERALELAKEQATAEHTLAQAMIAREDAAKELAAARERLNELDVVGKYNTVESMQAYKDAEAAVRDWTTALSDAEQVVSDAQVQLDNAEVSFNAIAEAMVGAGIAAEESAAQAEEGFNAAGDAIDVFTNITLESIPQVIQALGYEDEAFEKQMEILASYEEQATNMWGKINEAALVSIEEMIENLNYNAEAIDTWSSDIEALADRGINQGLLEILREAGPEARLSIAALVNATDEQLSELEEAFERSGQDAVDAYLRSIGMGHLISGTEDALSETAKAIESNTDIETAMGNKGPEGKEALDKSIVEADFPSSGDVAMEETAQGITESTHIEEAITDKTADARDHADTEVEENHFEEVGDAIAADESEGIRDSDAVDDAITEQIKDARDTADSAVTANNFDSVGRSIAEGIAAGIAQGTSAVVQAVQSLIESALSAAREAADAHSPARRFIPLGEDMDAGVAVGLGQRQLTKQASQELIAEAYSAAQSTQSRLGAVYGATVTNTSIVNSSTGGSVVFEKGAIVIESEVINDNLDADRVSRRIATKAANQMRLKGGLPRK